MPIDLSGLLADLRAESAALDSRLEVLTDEQWLTPTPAEGWDIRDTVSHLHYFDGAAMLSLTDAPAFAEHARQLLGGQLPSGFDVVEGHSIPGSQLLPRVQERREQLVSALEAAEPGVRVDWYGPPMSVGSFATARVMETWAHGQDVSDALGLPPVVSGRLKHVCHIGYGARAYAHLVHGVADSGAPVRLELSGPGAGAWGPADAPDRVTGTALDFALLVTQRRHLDDVQLEITGETAVQWMSIAQAFAGPAGTGRKPLT